jgi:hypothetical protein
VCVCAALSSSLQKQPLPQQKVRGSPLGYAIKKPYSSDAASMPVHRACTHHGPERQRSPRPTVLHIGHEHACACRSMRSCADPCVRVRPCGCDRFGACVSLSLGECDSASCLPACVYVLLYCVSLCVSVCLGECDSAYCLPACVYVLLYCVSLCVSVCLPTCACAPAWAPVHGVNVVRVRECTERRARRGC